MKSRRVRLALRFPRFTHHCIRIRETKGFGAGLMPITIDNLARLLIGEIDGSSSLAI